jgi:hypothetical protein
MRFSAQDKGDEVLHTSGGIEMTNSSLGDRACQFATKEGGHCIPLTVSCAFRLNHMACPLYRKKEQDNLASDIFQGLILPPAEVIPEKKALIKRALAGAGKERLHRPS